jgi:putative SOS response-associated peptidase YedK
MAVVLAPDAWPAWLGKETADPRQLKALLAPYPSAGMTCEILDSRAKRVKGVLSR